MAAAAAAAVAVAAAATAAGLLRYLKLSHVIQILHRDKQSKRRRSTADGMQFPGKRKQMLMLTLKLKALPSSYFCFLLLPSSPVLKDYLP